MADYIAIAKEIMKRRLYSVAVRGLQSDEQYKPGDFARESYEWDYENDCSTYFTTGALAHGTCGTYVNASGINMFFDDPAELATRIEAAAKKNGYSDRLAVIAGDRTDMDYDHPDENETRIIDAIVIAVID